MTRLEELRIQLMLRLGCAACAHLELPHVAECHHLISGSRRMGHWFTIPLCAGHHRGVWDEEQKQVLSLVQRVSIADGSKRWNAVYPEQRLLWQRIQERLGLSWPAPAAVVRLAAHLEAK